MSERVRELITHLGLIPHPERGYYVETYRSQLRVKGVDRGGASIAPATDPGLRSASTAIYFLITSEAPSTYLHRLRSDEVFHLYEGGPLDVLLLRDAEEPKVARLGLDLAKGERPQLVIPNGTWFGAELVDRKGHCLIGCTVAPGFEFADFELAAGAELAERFPSEAQRIARMSRPGE
ncbi:MAG TPA: cupin domain-containing protein [Polyangiaceae bacterium]|nr:cupin domain-containing protein [Polyangiaceae bacterium]